MMEEEVQLDISVSIGKKKYQLFIPKNSDLSTLVEQFLIKHSLSRKYHASIIALVKQKLSEQGACTNRQSSPSHRHQSLPFPSFHHQSKDSIQNKQQHRDQAHQENNSKNNEKSQIAHGDSITHNHPITHKTRFLNKIKEELSYIENDSVDADTDKYRSEEAQIPTSRNVYEQWKMKEKSRVIPAKSQPEMSPRPQKQLVQHSPDHFYRKGTQFLSKITKQAEQKYKELYPFQPNISSHTAKSNNNSFHQTAKLQPAQAIKLVNRLKKQSSHKDLTRIQAMLTPKGIQNRNSNNIDPIKEKVKRKDEQIDRVLHQMIKQGVIRNKTQIRSLSRTPFRKTAL